MRARPARIFFDGGCRPNPGPIEVAAVHRGIVHHRADIAIGTNNDAEWLALLHAIDIARAADARDCVFLGDAMLIVRQASGAWRPRTPDLARHHAAFVAARDWFTRIRVRHVRRSHNLAGIALDRIRENPGDR